MKRSKKAFETRKKKSGTKVENRTSSPGPAKREKIKKSKPGFFRDRGVRETIESIIVAVILALLFRAYEAEAFVIPTGSMAPTLEGRHLDTICPQCSYHYFTGASCENPERHPNARGIVFDSTCPICRYTHRHDRKLEGMQSNDDSFVGDRILVVKFAYEFSDPKRWDVIVFRYPGNAKQNYIKRLIGLPGETLMIRHGNIYISKDGKQFEIARKPPPKIKAMLQIVDDTNHIPEKLKQANWPLRWQQWRDTEDGSWVSEHSGKHPTFTIDGTNDSLQWLRYRNIVPRSDEWYEEIEAGILPKRLENFVGEAITDYYSYNNKIPSFPSGDPKASEEGVRLHRLDKRGQHWVGDLAFESNLEVKSNTGDVSFDLVQGGVHFYCNVDVATGEANLVCDSPDVTFYNDQGEQIAEPTASTTLKGSGKFRIRYANIDEQITLWINERVVKFTASKYVRKGSNNPFYSKNNPGDAEPAAIGSSGANIEISRLRMLRDIYYVSLSAAINTNSEYAGLWRSDEIRFLLEDPTMWNTERGQVFFSSRARNEFKLDKDQFFPMGDNSPESSDARIWAASPYVDRKYLTGKALFVYWPHPWRPFWPNFGRMGFIR